jgi:hypothetical protein
MICRFTYLRKFCSLVVLLFLFSCGESSDKKSETGDKEQEVSGTILQLKGKWVEKRDSLHILEFTTSEMVDFYNSLEINRYRLLFFDGLPGEGGYEDPFGRVIQIEESKDNFHHFTVLILDSNYLELIHRSSGIIKKYNRLK